MSRGCRPRRCLRVQRVSLLSIMNQKASSEDRVAAALLTGGGDKPYVFGLGTALASNGTVFDLIGSDDLDFPELRGNPGVKFLNLRGNQRPDVSFVSKMS